MDKRLFATPEECEAAFYRAFEAADISLMSDVWEDSTGISCIHPGQKELTGYDAVMSSWHNMFAEGPQLKFTVETCSRVLSNEMHMHVLHEHIQSPLSQGINKTAAIVVATHVYRRIEGCWRLVQHHASVIPKQKTTAAINTDSPTLH